MYAIETVLNNNSYLYIILNAYHWFTSYCYTSVQQLFAIQENFLDMWLMVGPHHWQNVKTVRCIKQCCNLGGKTIVPLSLWYLPYYSTQDIHYRFDHSCVDVQPYHVKSYWISMRIAPRSNMSVDHSINQSTKSINRHQQTLRVWRFAMDHTITFSVLSACSFWMLTNKRMPFKKKTMQITIQLSTVCK